VKNGISGELLRLRIMDNMDGMDMMDEK